MSSNDLFISQIIREDTALHILKDARGNKGLADANLIGKIVMTVYNNKTYRIEAVDWTKKPTSTFEVCLNIHNAK